MTDKGKIDGKISEPGRRAKPSGWSYRPSEGLKNTLRAIPLIIVLILGFSVGLTATRDSAGAANRLLDDIGGQHREQLEEAYSLIISGDFTEASTIAAAVVRIDPENALAHHILGLAHARRGLTDEAALSFGRATELYPDFDVAWYDLGVVEEARGEFESALEAYREAAGADGTNSTYSDAAIRIERIVIGGGGWDRKETEAGGLFLAGVTAVNRGDPDSLDYAENIYRTLLRDRPYDVASRNMLGLTLVRQGKLGEAERVLIQVVEAEPGYSDAWYNLGMLHRAQGRLEQALEDFEFARSTSSLETFRATASRRAAEIRELLVSEVNVTPEPQGVDPVPGPDTDPEADVSNE